MGYHWFGTTNAVLLGLLAESGWRSVVSVGDPTCWLTNDASLEKECCSGLRQGCWDQSYTFTRCCSESSSKESIQPPRLALGVHASRQLGILRSCWPDAKASDSYENCCALHHGVWGNADCWQPGYSFERCCEPVIVEGLDDCDSSSGSWCNSGQVGVLSKAAVDHRAYVGRGWGEDYWYKVGEEEFLFLVKIAKILPSTRVLDLGCGSLRMARWLIPFLDQGGYLGLDKSRRLIEAGWFLELDDRSRALSPILGVSDRFELDLLSDGSPPPEVSIAFSLLTHLNTSDITTLLSSLRKFTIGSPTPHRFYATLRVVPEESEKLSRILRARGLASNSHGVFYYTVPELRRMATAVGWRAEFPSYSGTDYARWGGGHKQQMVLFEAVM